MKRVWVNGRSVALDPARSLGKGGEADVYAVGGGLALKRFKGPDHPDLEGLPAEQDGARDRLDLHQRKLPAFPTGLPARVVTPVDLATDRKAASASKGTPRIVGYTMPVVDGAEVLHRFADRTFREAGGVGPDRVVRIFRDLHRTLADLHGAGVVVGDFNDLNVLVRAEEAHLIDADSFQFGGFPCSVFTERFVDPRLCDPDGPAPLLVRPHDADGDWYAFAVMLMQCLLYVGPHGGIHRPADPADRVAPGRRALERVTVFRDDVRYPKPAIPYGVLPDELLDRFHQVFVDDERGAFPPALLDDLRFTRCTSCDTVHARALCPTCTNLAPANVRPALAVRGQVRCRPLFRTAGVILEAAVHEGRLCWLYHEAGEFRREDGSVVSAGDLDPRMRFRLRGPDTLFGRDGQVVTFPGGPRTGPGGAAPERLGVDRCDGAPVFDTQGRTRFWSQAGRLMRDGALGPEHVGDVLAGQTRLWVGPDLGFGFYRADELSVAFVFDPSKRGLDDSVPLPPIRGQLVDATCVFSTGRAWVLTAERTAGKTLHRCALVRRDGTVEATTAIEADAEGGHGLGHAGGPGTDWLATLGGKCAAGGALFTATDDGILRAEAVAGLVQTTNRFPDTEPFVDAGDRLLAGGGGLWVVGRQEIRLLELG